MKNTFTLFKRALLCCSLGCCATMYADAQKYVRCNFSEEFYNLMQQENITRDEFFFKLSTTAEALDSIDSQSKIYYDDPQRKYYFDIDQDVRHLTGDSIKFYFSFYSGHAIIEKGEMMAAVADLQNSEKNVVMNPLQGAKKIIAECPTGIDGKPVSAVAGFITMHKDGTKSCYSDFGFSYYSPEYSLMLEAIPEGKNTAPFWIKSDLDYVYVVAPHTDVNTPQYLMSMQNVSAEAYPDTLTCDYSKAKKVTMGMKDLEGNYVDLKNYRIFNKITNVGGHMDDRIDKYFELRHFPQYDTYKKFQSVEFYALPGKHYIAYDGVYYGSSKGLDYPAGLEGIITVNEQEAEQRIDLDYSNYITLHKKGKAPFALRKLVCRNKVTGNVINKPEEKLVIDEKIGGCSYYSREAIVDGEEVLRIWPGFGYETIDIELNGITYKYEVKDLDIKSIKDYTFDMSNLYEMKISLPHFMLKNGYVCGDGNDSRRLIDSDRNNPEQCRDFDELSLHNAFFSEGQHQLDVILKNEKYDSITVNLPEDANKEITFGWKNSSIYSVNTEEIALSQINTTPKGTFIDSIQTGTQAELFYVYENPGEVEYEVNGPQENYIPLMGKFNVGEERPHTALSFAEHKEFKLIANRSSISGVTDDDPIWYGKNGEIRTFKWKIDENHDYSCYAQPGRFYIPVACRGNSSKRSVTIFPIEVEFNDTDSLKLSSDYCAVRFKNGEQILTYENFDHYMYAPTDTLDADVHIYALNFTPTQKEMKLRIYKGRRPEGAYLFPGFYRAEERSGKQIYFEVKPEDSKMVIDFANPPVGIEEVINGENLPAAFYDMSGRQLDAPQKGINIVRMQNGKVKKFIMK